MVAIARSATPDMIAATTAGAVTTILMAAAVAIAVTLAMAVMVAIAGAAATTGAAGMVPMAGPTVDGLGTSKWSLAPTRDGISRAGANCDWSPFAQEVG